MSGAVEYRLGSWHVEPDRNRIHRDGEERRLEPRSMDVLVFLMDDGGVVSAETLLDEVWGGRVVEESAVHQCVSKIRRALGDDRQNPQYLESIPRRGYRIVAPVECVAPHPGPSGSRRWRANLGWLAAGAFLVAVALLLVWQLRDPGPASVLAAPSVAVLPFENLSGEPDQGFFADGVTEMIISELGKVPTLRVISRVSVRDYRDSQLSPKSIARRLGVQMIVAGAVTRFGSRLQISVSLVDGATGQITWSDTFVSDVEDILITQSRVANALASRIDPEGTVAHETSPLTTHRIDPQVYNDFLRAVQLASASTADTVQGWGPRVISLLENVIEADPGFVGAWALLAGTLVQLDAAQGAPSERARRAAERALTLDPSSSDAHVAMGLVALNEWRFDEASEALQKAVRLGPNNPRALIAYARYLLDVECRVEEAIDLSARVPLLDPFNPYLLRERAELLWAGRYFEQALEESRAIRARFPEVFTDVEWIVYLALGRYEQGGEVVARLLAEMCTDDCEWEFDANAQGRQGGTFVAGWRAWRDGAMARPQGKGRLIAIVQTWLGEYDEAIDWLERAYESREPLLYTLRTRHLFDPLRDDARFQVLLDRVGFPASDLDPGIAAGLGKVYAYQGRSQEAVAALDRAIAASPTDARRPDWLYRKGLAHFGEGSYEEAVHLVDAALELSPGRYTTENLLLLQAASLAAQDEIPTARSTLERVIEQWPTLTSALLPLPPLTDPDLRSRYEEALLAAGLTPSPAGASGF